MKKLKEAGYTIKDACDALGISRSRYYSFRKAKTTIEDTIEETKEHGNDKEFLERIKLIKLNHPFWGYRRVTAWLRHRENLKVNHKRVWRLMREHGLLAEQMVHRVKRGSKTSKPKADRPRDYWGIDMTKFMLPSVGWIYLIIVLDWYTKKIVGWNLSLRGRSTEWRAALDMAIDREFPEGVRDGGLKLISDNGSQPTSISFMRDMTTLSIEQIFTSYDNPRGNADTERVIRTIKEELIWLNEFNSFESAKERIGKWITEDYNKHYVHSRLGYISPEEFEEKYESQHMKSAA